MQNKLQELTDKLYNEGLSKGKQAADQLLSNAKKEAAEIIANAKKEGEQIVANATKEALELKTKAENDIKMAGMQTISAVRQQIETAIIAKSVGSDIAKAANDTEFIKEIILTIAKAFNPSSEASVDLNLILPEKQEKEFGNFITAKLHEICKEGLTVTYSKSLDNGFKIGPKDGGYLINFTEEEFNGLISQYIRPKTRSILFG